MKEKPLRIVFVIGMVLTVVLAWDARAQNAETSAAAPTTAAPELRQTDPANTNALASTTSDGQAEERSGLRAKHSPGVDDVLRMIHAGVSTEVIRTYIENSPTKYSLSPAEIIALKKQGVPDELTAAMMKRGSALAAEQNQPRQASSVVLPYPSSGRSYGGLDPEGYDYFHYYYLYPRTLAWANQRLYTPYPSSQGYWPYSGYGYYGPAPFNPLPPSAFSHR
jgi:hypothetical protein